MALLTSNYQLLVGSLCERDRLVQGEEDHLNAQLDRHRAKLNVIGPEVEQLMMDQVALGQQIDVLETRVCRCGDDSKEDGLEDGGSSYIPFPSHFVEHA